MRRHNTLNQRVIQIFYEKMNSGVIVIDDRGFITYINHLCEQILGVERDESLGRHYNDVFAHVPAEERFTLITLETGYEFENLQHGHFFNDRYFVTDTALLKDGDEVLGAVGFFKDVTEIRNIRKKLEESIKLYTIGQMAAGAAHEIRNPLTTVKGLLQLMQTKLEKGNLKEEHLKNYINVMLSEIDAINEIIKDFIFLADPSKSEMTQVDINKLIYNVLNITKGDALAFSVDTSLNLEQGALQVWADPSQLKQVLINVTGNAYQAMGPGGKLSISTRRSQGGNHVVIEIRDTGQGIPEQDIGRIYDPFFTTKNEGTGLGLAVVKRIIDAHGGEVTVKSRRGEGTCFTIKLPAALEKPN